MQALVMKDAWLKDFRAKIGDPKAKITICVPATPQIARDLGVFSDIYQQDGTPKQRIVEVELDPKISNFQLKMQALNVPLDLHLSACEEASEFIAKRTGATKKSKVSRLILQFKVKYRGSMLGFLEWAEKYGTMQCDLVMSASLENGDLFAEPPKAKKKGKRSNSVTITVEEAEAMAAGAVQ